MPRAGKTTALEIAESYLKREGQRVRTVHEGARISPLDKSDRFNYNAWSFHNTVNRILEARLDHYDFVLVDRGVLDHMAFLDPITPIGKHVQMHSAASYYRQFLNLQDVEIYFRLSPDEAIEREGKHKPFLGRVFDGEFLENLSDSYERTVSWAKDNLKEWSVSSQIHEINGKDSSQINGQKIIDLFQRLI